MDDRLLRLEGKLDQIVDHLIDVKVSMAELKDMPTRVVILENEMKSRAARNHFLINLLKVAGSIIAIVGAGVGIAKAFGII